MLDRTVEAGYRGDVARSLGASEGGRERERERDREREREREKPLRDLMASSKGH